MKKILFPLVAILLLAGCSSSEDVIDEPEPPKYSINSTVQVGDIKLQSYIFEGDYYIEAIDESGNKAFTIKDKAEGYIEDLGFGETKEYPVNGCFILSALNKNDHLYILVSLYGAQVAHPHKFMLKVREGKIVKKEYLDIYDPKSPSLRFYPEKIAEWYGEYIVIYSTIRTSAYFISVLDKDLNIIWKNLTGFMHTEKFIAYIEQKNYIALSVKNMVYIAGNTVNCVDISDYAREELCFATQFDIDYADYDIIFVSEEDVCKAQDILFEIGYDSPIEYKKNNTIFDFNFDSWLIEQKEEEINYALAA